LAMVLYFMARKRTADEMAMAIATHTKIRIINARPRLIDVRYSRMLLSETAHSPPFKQHKSR